MIYAKQSYLNRDYSILEQKGRCMPLYHILSWFTIVWFCHDVWFWHVFAEFWHRLHWVKTPGLMPSTLVSLYTYSKMYQNDFAGRHVFIRKKKKKIKMVDHLEHVCFQKMWKMWFYITKHFKWCSIGRLREKTKIFDQKNEIEAWKNEKKQKFVRGKARFIGPTYSEPQI